MVTGACLIYTHGLYCGDYNGLYIYFSYRTKKGEIYMFQYKTKCKYGYSILGERPPRLDTNAKYVIIGQSKFFLHCVIIRRLDGKRFLGEKYWIVPQNSLY